MAIEPLGSVMTIQAQGSVAPKPVVQERTAENYTNTNVEPAEKIDRTTGVVENAQGKGAADSSQQENEKQLMTNEQIKKGVEQLNKRMAAHSEAIFGIHEETNRVMIKIVDKDTKKVLKELPPEKTLDMIAKVWEIAGILIDEKR
ncbi:MAG: flagellar protein FlaG [Acetatifactor sp.]|nr:flagellar protein FlaG [Acetatifactor sp.]